MESGPGIISIQETFLNRSSSRKPDRRTLVRYRPHEPSPSRVPNAVAAEVRGRVGYNRKMFKVLNKQRLQRTRRLMRGERLDELKFSEAFDCTLSMMALLIDMTASFTSPSEFRRLPNRCGSLPPARQFNEEKNKEKNARRRY